ncbi:hypothetical protein TI05_03070 [Achromatium sp. WMS3]|nr:hypothetical protein TI05_03070 [Achromatium sp. WMS3]
MSDEPIKVLLVDDSPLVLVMLSRILSAPDSGIQVVGNARDGEEALRKIPILNPHVICTDLQMSGMDGLELARQVMLKHPRPVIVLSAAVERGKDNDNIYKLQQEGVVSIMQKPRGNTNSSNLDEIGKDLVAKIRQIGKWHKQISSR